jgi:hypothetical protein
MSRTDPGMTPGFFVGHIGTASAVESGVRGRFRSCSNAQEIVNARVLTGRATVCI